MNINFEKHPLWDFALQVYGQNGVPSACIALQDRHTLDVNIILLSLWLGYSGRPLIDQTFLERVLDVSTRWNKEVVWKIRSARVVLKEKFSSIPLERSETLRQGLLALEIDCEHSELLAFAGIVDTDPNTDLGEPLKLAICLANLSLYFNHLNIDFGVNDFTDIKLIISATFPDLEKEILKTSMESFAAL